MEIFGNANNLNVIKNPFSKDNITGISIVMGKNVFSGGFYFRGDVEFRNGQTQGRQVFNGDNLVDVFIKVKEFCESLD